MKKLLALCLTAVLCLCCLASCGSAHKENEWFSEEKLTNCLVGDLPTIEKDYVSHNDVDIYVSFTAGEREAYVAEVFEYLKSQNFKYLGTRGEQASTLAGTFTTYYFKPATELSEFYVGSSYKFVYSDGTLDEGGDPIFCILTIYDYEAKNLEYGTKNFAYNTLITLRYKSEAPLSGRYALKEEECNHEWDDGVEVEGGNGGYVMEYTCLKCGEKHSETITIIPPTDYETNDGQFTAYKNQVTKDEFQKQYAQAFNNLQPDYQRDFVYVYTNDFKETYENGEDIHKTNERIEYDADSDVIIRHYEFQNNDKPTPTEESYFWEYLLVGENVSFYDSRTDKSETRSLGFDEFWELAKNQVLLVLLPNPNKLYNDSTYYIDKDKDGNTVFTLYSSYENGYSLRQIVFSDTEMLYRTKSYTKEEDYEDTVIDVYRVYNENLTLTPHS